MRIAYAANDDRTARRISDLLGEATERKVQKSHSGSGLFLNHRSESEQEYGRALLTPGEVQQLPADDAILLVGGLLPYRARKIRSFLDPRFRDRAAWPAPDTPEEQARELPLCAPSDWEAPVDADACDPVDAGAEAACAKAAGRVESLASADTPARFPTRAEVSPKLLRMRALPT